MVEVATATVRRLGPGDWERSRAIRLRSLLEVPDAFWSTYEEELAFDEATWVDRLDRDRSATFLAEADGRDVGMVVASVHHDDESVGGIYAMYVTPDARGTGVGQALVEAAVEWSRARGFTEVRLDVGDWNTHAAALYRRCGFAPTGRRDAFPSPREHVTEHELSRRT